MSKKEKKNKNKKKKNPFRTFLLLVVFGIVVYYSYPYLKVVEFETRDKDTFYYLGQSTDDMKKKFGTPDSETEFMYRTKWYYSDGLILWFEDETVTSVEFSDKSYQAMGCSTSNLPSEILQRIDELKGAEVFNDDGILMTYGFEQDGQGYKLGCLVLGGAVDMISLSVANSQLEQGRDPDNDISKIMGANMVEAYYNFGAPNQGTYLESGEYMWEFTDGALYFDEQGSVCTVLLDSYFLNFMGLSLRDSRDKITEKVVEMGGSYSRLESDYYIYRLQGYEIGVSMNSSGAVHQIMASNG